MEKSENVPDLKIDFPNIYEELSFLAKEEQLSLIDITAKNKDDLSKMYSKYESRIEYCYFYYWLLRTLVSKDNRYYFNTCVHGCFFFNGKNANGFQSIEKKVYGENNFQFSIEQYFFDGKYLLISDRGDNSSSGQIYIRKFANINQQDLSTEKSNTYNNQLLLVKKQNYSVYKIHLMPTQKTFLRTLYTICKLFNENPLVDSKSTTRLNSLLYYFKAYIPAYQKEIMDNFPLIIIYIPTIFIKNDEINAIQNSDDIIQYVDYEKSKKCAETLLTYLVYFFNKKENKDCTGSDILPRYSQKVTSMIFFAQGHGDLKEIWKNNKAQFFVPPDYVYLTPLKDENFKINTEKIIEEANELAKLKSLESKTIAEPSQQGTQIQTDQSSQSNKPESQSVDHDPLSYIAKPACQNTQTNTDLLFQDDKSSNNQSEPYNLPIPSSVKYVLCTWEKAQNSIVTHTHTFKLYQQATAKTSSFVKNENVQSNEDHNLLIQQATSYVDSTIIEKPDTLIIKKNFFLGLRLPCSLVLLHNGKILLNNITLPQDIDTEKIDALMDVKNNNNYIRTHTAPQNIFNSVTMVIVENQFFKEKIGTYDTLNRLTIQSSFQYNIYTILQYYLLLIFLYRTCLFIHQKKL